MAIEIFNRFENKYLVSQAEYERLLIDLSPKMRLDKHNLDGKMYKIYNTYYDTADDNVIRSALEKPTFREKIRLRSYEVVKKPDDIVFVEIKRKYDGEVNKRRTKMNLGEAKRFLAGAKINPQTHMNPQVVRELEEIVEREQPLVPKVHISYERMALFDKSNDDLRISFDHNIITRRHNVELDRDDPGVKLLPSDKYLMEVKVRRTMPLWLIEIINQYNLKPISFSKYGKEYINKLKENYV
ncbi:MAG: polyphosphate polymerase domain-containing protein [Candidatus Saccharimonadales bacterium]